ncbi:hypothetical protein GE21DRAFT_1040567 [Neurospora crassa]|nr:hypothetical protein GE21DRAFT_1040567 [Neurospora crassa]
MDFCCGNCTHGVWCPAVLTASTLWLMGNSGGSVISRYRTRPRRQLWAPGIGS